MARFDSEHLRNIVLLSHSGAGKTALSEAMLSAAGVTSRLGTVEDGTTASDYEPEEQRRNASTQIAILPCPWRDHKINTIDTPGYADYRGEVISGIRVADGAIIVVAGPSGVEVGTRQMWQMADERHLPRIIFVNKMDRENVDFQGVMDSLVEGFGRRCVALQVPIGSEANFSGSVSLLDQSADVPDDLREQVEAARERLIEAIAESDDDLATKYLEGEPISTEEITTCLRQGMASGAIVPVLLGAATAEAGATELMNAIVDLMPSAAEPAPTNATNPTNQEEVALACDADGPLAALVFKSTADPFVGKLSYLRVYSGAFKSDSQVWNASRGEPERVAQVFIVRGKAQDPVDELGPGDIGAVSKLSSLLTGDTLSQRDTPLVLPGLEFPTPVYQMAAYPRSTADLDKITSALARIGEEDPSLNVTREPDTLEILLGGLGDTHVGVAVEKMKRKFGVDIELKTPKVPYMETITASTRVEYRHKKQTGGHGQFGHVWLEIEPLPRGAGFEFQQKVVGGAVPREYIPAVEKGVQKAMADGVLAGYPVVDLRATLVDGSFHPVDSSGICFEIAGGHALSKGIREAKPVLLEPVMLARVTVPESDTGEVIGDLNSKRARIHGMSPGDNGLTTIEVEVPRAEMLRYATELRSQTQGRGTFTIQFDHYDAVPAHLVQRIVQAREEAEASV
jgi:elongation factor G